MSELKPCPFCGGDAKLQEYCLNSVVPSVFIVCEHCDIVMHQENIMECVHKWNTRAPQPIETVYVVEMVIDDLKKLNEVYCVCRTEEQAKEVANRIPNSIYQAWDIEPQKDKQ